MNDLIELLRTRIKSRWVGSIGLVWFAMNWKAAFIVGFEKKLSMAERIARFEQITTPESLYFWPIFLGLLLALISPVVSLGMEYLVSKPNYVRQKRQIENDTELARLKLSEEQIKTELEENLKLRDLLKSDNDKSLKIQTLEAKVSDTKTRARNLQSNMASGVIGVLNNTENTKLKISDPAILKTIETIEMLEVLTGNSAEMQKSLDSQIQLEIEFLVGLMEQKSIQTVIITDAYVRDTKFLNDGTKAKIMEELSRIKKETSPDKLEELKAAMDRNQKPKQPHPRV